MLSLTGEPLNLMLGQIEHFFYKKMFVSHVVRAYMVCGVSRQIFKKGADEAQVVQSTLCSNRKSKMVVVPLPQAVA